MPVRIGVVLSALFVVLLGTSLPATASPEPVRRLLYLVSPDAAGGQGGRGIYVFDIDDGHRFVRKIDLSLKGTRGVCASAAAGRLWISHGDTSVLCLDLKADRVLWEKTYPRRDGCDRLCCTPDGKKVYVPSGTWSGSPEWKILDGPSGRELGRFRPHKSGGGHNAVVSLEGTRLFCASKANNFLAVVDTATDKVVAEVGPVGGGIHPFTVNAAGIRCFLNTGRAGVGFEVGDLRTGKLLHLARVPGLESQKRLCHGIGLTPDEKEVWLNDQGQVHIFDVAGSALRFVETVKLTGRAHGWTTFSLDGRFAYPDSGDVFDARTHQVAARLTDQASGQGKRVSSSKMIEVHFRGGKVVAVGDQFGLGRKAAAGLGARGADAGVWIDLLPGPDLKGWKRVPIPPDRKLGAKDPWKLDAGRKTLICDGVGVKEMLLYDRAFKDGVLHVEWRFRKVAGAPEYNSGVYVRTAADGSAWVQAQVAHTGKPPRLGDLFSERLVDGKVKRVAVPGRGAELARPPGELNTYEVTFKGKSATVSVNGALATTWDDCPALAGRIGLQAEYFAIEFKGLKFKVLD
jgi:YVTN family beta-propeller protein